MSDVQLLGELLTTSPATQGDYLGPFANCQGSKGTTNGLQQLYLNTMHIQAHAHTFGETGVDGERNPVLYLSPSALLVYSDLMKWASSHFSKFITKWNIRTAVERQRYNKSNDTTHSICGCVFVLLSIWLIIWKKWKKWAVVFHMVTSCWILSE